jgi:hypothetical protein
VREKVTQNVSQLVFFGKIRGKRSPKHGLPTSVIFQQQPQVISQPMGVNSPNLVTLLHNVRLSTNRVAVYSLSASRAGLPDGLYLIPKIPIWVYFGGSWNG